jgi:hypothetical protein
MVTIKGHATVTLTQILKTIDYFPFLGWLVHGALFLAVEASKREI